METAEGTAYLIAIGCSSAITLHAIVPGTNVLTAIVPSAVVPSPVMLSTGLNSLRMEDVDIDSMFHEYRLNCLLGILSQKCGAKQA